MTKFVGADDYESNGNSWWSCEADRALRDSFPHRRYVQDSRTTELGKLLDLSRYGIMIAFAREQATLCQSLGLDYQIVVDALVVDKNTAMEARGTPDLRQQRLTPPTGPLGGHCVLPGMARLCEQFGDHLPILRSAYQQEHSLDDDNKSVRA